jgi:PAS domain-containing protein
VITFSDVAAEPLHEARLYAESIVDTVREPLLVLDQDLRVRSANRSFCATFHVSQEGTVGRLLYELGNRQWDIPKLRTLLGDILPQKQVLKDFELEPTFESIGPLSMQLNARTIDRGGDRPCLILLAIEDLTEPARSSFAPFGAELAAGIEGDGVGIANVSSARGTTRVVFRAYGVASFSRIRHLMKTRGQWNMLARCAAAIALFGMPVIAQAKQPMKRISVPASRSKDCPCMADSFYASFCDGQCQLLTCTDNTPLDHFVRLVAADLDLVVLFEFPPQLFCGWQANGSDSSWMPVTAAQFDSCKRLIVDAAASGGIPCLPEFETAP